MKIETLDDFEHHIMNQFTRTIEGLDNLLEQNLISPEEYSVNVKKARLLFELRFHNFKKTYIRSSLMRYVYSFFPQ